MSVEEKKIGQIAESRYLDYALSVVEDRAIPDVRDGLKPVQRRILYAMWEDLGLTSDSRHRKSAAVVGKVLGNYHPHGDKAVYDALVRMAQPFALRLPLVDGHGNFGSVDGDPAAAQRYTEAKLQPSARLILGEVDKDTVNFTSNYDNTSEEPEVLPTKIPLILVNGAVGIAVGLSTSIPPHNVAEVIDGMLARLDGEDLDDILSNHLKGPDFPTGGKLIDGNFEDIYETGEGSVTVRSHFEVDGNEIIIQDLPYQVNKEDLVEDMQEKVLNDEIPHIKDVQDHSTDDIEIRLKLKEGKSAKPAVAFMFDETDLQTKFHVNMTALTPSQSEEGESSVAPKQMGLVEIIDAFLDFRQKVILRRAKYERSEVKDKIHRLETYEKIYGDLDRATDILQKPRSSARGALKKEFGLDGEQCKILFRSSISNLLEDEVEKKKQKLSNKRDKREGLTEIIESSDKQEELLRAQLKQVRKIHGDTRQTEIDLDAPSYTYSDRMLIEDEDVHLILTENGWASTHKSYSDVSRIRTHEDDRVQWVLKTNQKEKVLFFTDRGKVYTSFVADIEKTAGYGNPIQTEYSFSDGESVVQVMTTDNLQSGNEIVAMSSEHARSVRFAVDDYLEPSTVRGRTFMKEEGRVVNVNQYDSSESACAVSKNGRVHYFDPSEISKVKSAAKGVLTLNLEDDDYIIAFRLLGSGDKMEVTTCNGASRELTSRTYSTSSNRRGDGNWLIKRGDLDEWNRKQQIS